MYRYFKNKLLKHSLILEKTFPGLFHKAIAQSGAQCELVTLYNAVGLTSELAKEFGCTSSDPEETVACLRNIEAQELAEKQTQLVTPLVGSSLRKLFNRAKGGLCFDFSIHSF